MKNNKKFSICFSIFGPLRKHFKHDSFAYKLALVTIRFWYLDDFLTQSAIVWGCFFSPGSKQEMLILKTMKKSEKDIMFDNGNFLLDYFQYLMEDTNN